MVDLIQLFHFSTWQGQPQPLSFYINRPQESLTKMRWPIPTNSGRPIKNQLSLWALLTILLSKRSNFPRQNTSTLTSLWTLVLIVLLNTYALLSKIPSPPWSQSMKMLQKRRRLRGLVLFFKIIRVKTKEKK